MRPSVCANFVDVIAFIHLLLLLSPVHQDSGVCVPSFFVFRSAFSQLEAWRRALVKLWEEMKWRIVEGAHDREVATTYLPSATMPQVA